MTTFNQFKNNTEILRKYLQKMNTVTESDIRPQWIQQSFLKQHNPHIFLQLLHYVLIDFSPFVIFVKVLDYYPTIKDDNDKKFVSNVMSLARKMFQVDVKIDIEQFLSQKFVQKKTQWMAQFCKSVYQMHLKENKKGQEKEIKSSTSLNVPKKNSQPVSLKQVSKNSSNFIANDDDSQDQAPRNLNLLPSNSRKPIIEKTSINFVQQKVNESSSDEDMKQLLTKKNQLNKMKQKVSTTEKKFNLLSQKNQQLRNQGNISKNIPAKKAIPDQNRKRFNQQQQEIDIDQDQMKTNIYKSQRQKNSNKNQFSNIPEQDQNQYSFKQDPSQRQENGQNKQYVTREQLMQIMGGVAKNFSQILGKFNQFQQQVGGWVQNINAKISIIQENVKTIKNNL